MKAKCCMRQLNDTGGAVSVFLIIIFLSLLFLAGIIVDAARIMVAENKTEIALSSAVRSVLADYDSQVVGEFGLFAVDRAGTNEAFRKYFLVNLEERHQGIVIIRYQVKDIKVEGVAQGTLLNNKVFENQVLQYIKYKAPLTMARDFIDTIRGGNFQKKSGLLQDGVEAMSVHENARQKISEINKKLGDLDKYLEDGDIEGLASLEKIFALDIEEVLLDYRRYKELLERANVMTCDLHSNKYESVGDKGTKTDRGHAESINLENKINKLQKSLEENALLLRQIIMLTKELKSLNKDDGRIADKYNQIRTRINDLAAQIKPLRDIETTEIHSSKISRQSAASIYKTREMLAKLAGRSITANNPVTQLISQEEFFYANQSSSKDEGGNANIDWQRFEPDINLDLKKAYGLLSLMSDFIKDISGALENMAEEGRDKLYIADYVLDKYTFLTSQTKRDHYFDRGEIEYILCGNNQENSNLTEVFGRIFFLRFSINTIDALIRSTSPHFMLRLAESLAKGFEKACEDIINLYQGKGVPLCAEVGYTLKYSDYLRLFLLLQEKEPQLDRMRRLIQIDLRKDNPGFRLNDKYTILNAETSIAINLWFLPALHLDKLGFAQFEGGKYSFNRSINLGY